MTVHRCRTLGALISAGAVLALVVSGCTPSVSTTAPTDPFAQPIVPRAATNPVVHDEAQSGTLGAGEPRTGRGVVRTAVIEGAQLPEAVSEAFRADTGFELQVTQGVRVSELTAQSFDVVVGLDPTDAQLMAAAGTIGTQAPEDAVAIEDKGVDGVPAAIAYGRDDVCVVADAVWISANRVAVPAGLDDLIKTSYASQLVIPDPSTSSIGRAFIQGVAQAKGGDASAWEGSVKKEGVQVVASADEAIAGWSARASAGAGMPFVVAPRSTLSLVLANTGVESAGVAAETTCVQRYLYAAGVAGEGEEYSDGAESLMAWLQGWQAQRQLAQLGAVDPLDLGASQDSAAQWFLTPGEGAIVLGDWSPEVSRAAVKTWVEAVSQ
ncbi:hypothetical protein [Schaalia vaccimaxillae]|uniref:hypothetical protein n=1 Tax=Schaalia vaccimaxillae TaxID=183916 RepID=UPI0003B76508|nr:hypothetical protein [Schaalia vaccimaxillae]